MSVVSAKKKNEAIEILRTYNGGNPFIWALKKDVCLKGNINGLTDLAVEYIILNHNVEPKPINKTISIADWYGEKLKNDWDVEFIPEKLRIITLLGETSISYHCIIKYRQNMEPMKLFIPKKAVLDNFLLEDYHNFSVDFDRYDRLSMAKDPNRKLKSHQKEGIQFLLSRKKCVIADDMGLGKSLQLSVAAIEGNFDSIIIICPASLKTNWKNELLWYVPERDITIIESFQDKNKTELEKFLGYGEGKSGKSVQELKEEAKERGKWNENRFVIVNYDILDEFYEIPVSRSAENIEKALKNSPMLQFIKNKKSLIIIDEAHRLSNMQSKQYKIIKDLIKRGNPDSLYLATGTPITNNPQNYYNLLNLIGDPITDDWNYYMQRYCGAIEIPRNTEEREKRNEITARYVKSRGKKTWYELTEDEKKSLNESVKKQVKMITIAKDGTNLDELKKRTSHLYLRRVKEDLTDLNVTKTIHEIFYDFDIMQMMEYEKLWEEYETAQLEADPEKEINKELLEGAIYRKYCSNQMIPNTIKLAESFIDKGEKVVIMCCYDEEIYALKEHFGDSSVLYNGKISAKEKDKAISEFKNNANVKVFLGNLIAAGVGINLVCSNTMIFNNFDYVPGNCRQAEDRCFRIGQTKDVNIYYQMFRDTQYEKIWNTIMKKELTINQVIKKESEK